jgi:glucose-6-phosphate 1-dehydrogenase
VRSGLDQFVDDLDDDVVRDFLSRLSFQTSSADDGADLAAVVSAARERLGHDARTLIYLSVPPTAMQSMIGMLGREHLAGDARVIIEKPFGTDLASSRDLDAALKEVLDEEQVYRIDHFLGKEAVQNILALRFANSLMESAWNREHLVSVQIDVPETLTVEGPAASTSPPAVSAT